MKRTALALSIAMTTFARAASAQTSPAEPPIAESPPPAAATQSSAVVLPTQLPAPPPTSLIPSRALTPRLPGGKNRFTADPVGDSAILGIALGFGALSETILGTGEIRPQQVLTTYDTNRLFFIDRGALTQTLDANASLYSTVGLVAVVSFAAIDPVLTGFREQSRRAALVDAVIYAETLSIAWGITNLAKVTVRRPRPSAYITAAAHKGDPTFNNTDTDSALSFFSGHAAICASVSATATYLAFSRSGPSSVRPWVTLIAGTLLTSFVAVERVRSGAHFPTDVIAGSLAGAGVGILVPHLHREDTITQRPVWIGFAPVGGGASGEGGTATFSGIF